MYETYFGLRENPFAITPDPNYLFMSAHHREALAHLLYGTGEHGGFVQLTGEVGTGKTTLIRTLLEQHLENVEVALCLNPRLTVEEFVATVCDELHINYPCDSHTLKPLLDALNAHLLNTHAQGKRTVLIIDEAQNLSREVLEQVRLLTNLETHRHKLLRIILVGQPELQGMLERKDMRQLAQRITARYHLRTLNRQETVAYILHRLQTAGGRADLFTPAALRSAYDLTKGVPRLLNVICDRALLGAYSKNRKRVTAALVRHAAREALQGKAATRTTLRWASRLSLIILLIGGVALLYLQPAHLIVKLPMPTVINAPIPPPPAENTPPSPPPISLNKTTPTILEEQAEIKALFNTPQANDEVLKRLLATWGQETAIPPAISPCDYAKTRSLRCLTGRGGWEELRRYNLPVILRLATSKGDTRQVLLRSLEGVIATLDFAERPVQINLALLDLLWTGDYLLLWRPPIPQDFIGPGSRGAAVTWLQQRLARAEGTPPPAELVSDFFDASLRERVRLFQQAHGLHADGLVGVRTMLYLNGLEPPADTPSLTTAGKPQ